MKACQLGQPRIEDQFQAGVAIRGYTQEEDPLVCHVRKHRPRGPYQVGQLGPQASSALLPRGWPSVVQVSKYVAAKTPSRWNTALGRL
jgi:hypothetical protein